MDYIWNNSFSIISFGNIFENIFPKNFCYFRYKFAFFFLQRDDKALKFEYYTL